MALSYSIISSPDFESNKVDDFKRELELKADIIFGRRGVFNFQNEDYSFPVYGLNHELFITARLTMPKDVNNPTEEEMAYLDKFMRDHPRIFIKEKTYRASPSMSSRSSAVHSMAKIEKKKNALEDKNSAIYLLTKMKIIRYWNFMNFQC